jgi:fatty-acyl-CoA synthase
MTEMAGYVVALRWDDPPERRRSEMGDPLPGVELKIVDPDAASGVGEIRVRGPGLFSGYYKEPAGSGLDADGFLMTGDLGRVDRSGTLSFAGRSKDLLRVKGINVSPVEVESVLQSHPGVENAYIVGISVNELDQEIVALVVAKQGESVTEKTLRQIAEEGLSHYKRPQRYLFICREDVPLGTTGKPQREALAELIRVGRSSRQR